MAQIHAVPPLRDVRDLFLSKRLAHVTAAGGLIPKTPEDGDRMFIIGEKYTGLDISNGRAVARNATFKKRCDEFLVFEEEWPRVREYAYPVGNYAYFHCHRAAPPDQIHRAEGESTIYLKGNATNDLSQLKKIVLGDMYRIFFPQGTHDTVRILGYHLPLNQPHPVLWLAGGNFYMVRESTSFQHFKADSSSVAFVRTRDNKGWAMTGRLKWNTSYYVLGSEGDEKVFASGQITSMSLGSPARNEFSTEVRLRFSDGRRIDLPDLKRFPNGALFLAADDLRMEENAMLSARLPPIPK